MYRFPVTDKYEAKEVTQPDYQPDLFDHQNLYTNLDSIRGERYLTEMLFDLNIDLENFELRSRTKEYTKILFSGHRGCGKSPQSSSSVMRMKQIAHLQCVLKYRKETKKTRPVADSFLQSPLRETMEEIMIITTFGENTKSFLFLN